MASNWLNSFPYTFGSTMYCTTSMMRRTKSLSLSWQVDKLTVQSRCNSPIQHIHISNPLTFIHPLIITWNIVNYASIEDEESPSKISMLRHKNDGLSISFLEVFFPTPPPLLIPNFYDVIEELSSSSLEVEIKGRTDWNYHLQNSYATNNLHVNENVRPMWLLKKICFCLKCFWVKYLSVTNYN